MRLQEYLKINVWLLPVLLFILPAILALFGSFYLTTQNNYPFYQLDDGWTISHGDFYQENVHLDEVNIGTTLKGDIVTMTTTLPSTSIPSGCIMFRSLLSTVTVLIDGEVVYEYGNEYEEKGLLIPKHYNHVPIKSDQLGKEREIRFNVTENDAFTGMSYVYYGNRSEVDIHLLQSRRLDLVAGVFLCLFGFMLLTLSSYLYMYHGRDLSLIFSSLISFILGAYSLAFNDIFSFISDNDYFFNILEYLSLYSIPFAIIVFLATTHQDLNTNLTKILIAVNVLFPLITLFLHVFNVVHINIFVSTLHFIAIIEAAIALPSLIVSVLKNIIKYKDSPDFSNMTSDSILIIGLAFFILCCVIDIVKYNFLKTFGAGGEAYTSIGFMTIGALCFVLCLFVFYFFHGIEHKNAAYMKEHLEGLAYTDTLTGLMNRAKCMQYMASVHGKFAIISLDMDNLKTVNDSLGHLEGDHMIKEFSDIMKQAFSGAQLIGRTGGDEFIVGLENPAPGDCERMITDLESRMEDFNKKSKTLSLSSSCGFAYSSEVSSKSAQDVFNLADSRMYEIKEKHHTNRLNKIMLDLFAEELSGIGGTDNE